jgi:hypothetical protein
MKPYTDNSNIRTFSKDVDPMELVWHQDKEDIPPWYILKK